MDLSYIKEQSFRIYLLLAFTRDSAKKVRSQELAGIDIYPEQASILMAIKHLGAQATPTEIGKLIPRDSQTISGILSRMEKRGLVKRVKKTKTTKATSIVLTEEGSEAAEKAACHGSILKLFQALTQEELDVLERSLLKLYHASEEMNAVER